MKTPRLIDKEYPEVRARDIFRLFIEERPINNRAERFSSCLDRLLERVNTYIKILKELISKKQLDEGYKELKLKNHEVKLKNHQHIKGTRRAQKTCWQKKLQNEESKKFEKEKA